MHSPVEKDTVLDRLSDRANVAQFVSFGADLGQRFARIRGHAPNGVFDSLEAAIRALFAVSPEGSVNIRTFAREKRKGREFLYGLCGVEEAAAAVRRLAAAGLGTVVNETIDVGDGGVSGVAFGGLLEFAPGDTPRCVEKPGTVSISHARGMRLLETVYGFRPALDPAPGERIEFSLHPLRCGFRHEHTILWELEEVEATQLEPDLRWPNRFSRMIGDKAFGLLVADVLGLPVPATFVLSRALPPFRLGTPTGTGETWIRTCPAIQTPGRFTTQRGWRDPFRLMPEEDPEGTLLASVLAQEGVEAAYSGALVASSDGEPIIEGVEGQGDTFMVGKTAPAAIPSEVVRSVRHLYDQASAELGPVRCEWVFDGRQAWIVQLHRGATATSGRILYPGEAASYRRFAVSEGIEALRALIPTLLQTGEGLILAGDVGVTSHLGDLLRQARIPSRLEGE